MWGIISKNSYYASQLAYEVTYSYFLLPGQRQTHGAHMVLEASAASCPHCDDECRGHWRVVNAPRDSPRTIAMGIVGGFSSPINRNSPSPTKQYPGEGFAVTSRRCLNFVEIIPDRVLVSIAVNLEIYQTHLVRYSCCGCAEKAARMPPAGEPVMEVCSRRGNDDPNAQPKTSSGIHGPPVNLLKPQNFEFRPDPPQMIHLRSG